MAQFYRVKTQGQPDALFDSTTNQKILNPEALKAGGYNQEAPAPINSVTLNTPKTPVSSTDISNGLNLGDVKPPAPNAPSIYDNFTKNASQFSEYQTTIMQEFEKQRAEAQTQIADLQKQQADNQANIDKNIAAIKENSTASVDNPDVMGWRQQALGITGESLKTKQQDLESFYTEYKNIADETKVLNVMMFNDLETEKNRPALLSVSQGRQVSIKENYVGKIAVNQAALAAVTGKVNLAENLIDRGIETINADRTDRIAFLNFMQGIYEQKDSKTGQAILTATKEEKDAIANEISILDTKNKEMEANKTWIKNLFTDTQTALTATKAGVTLSDTPEAATKKISDYVIAHPNEFDNGKVTYQKIGTDANGNDVYGFVDTGKQTVNGGAASGGTPNIATGAGVVATSTGEKYNIASYATDPNHETSVQNILNGIGQFKTVSDIDNYIKKVSPNSPITGAMVEAASKKYGVSWEMMVAMMQQDSSLGTEGKGARTFNPGNVGNTDSGAERNYKTWQAGVDAVAQNLAWRKAAGSPQPVVNQEAADWVKLIKNKEVKLSDVKGANDVQTAKLKKDVISLMANSGSISKADAETTAKLQDKVDQIDDLIKKTSTTGSGVVGPTWLARWSTGHTFTGTEQEFVGSVKQLISKETLDTLINLKKSGGTLGALSDQERLMLQNAATKIGAWELKDKNGIGKGVWAVSEASFKKELESIKSITKRALENAGGETGAINALEQALSSNPDKISEYDVLVRDNPNLSDDDIIQLLGLQ